MPEWAELDRPRFRLLSAYKKRSSTRLDPLFFPTSTTKKGSLPLSRCVMSNRVNTVQHHSRQSWQRLKEERVRSPNAPSATIASRIYTNPLFQDLEEYITALTLSIMHWSRLTCLSRGRGHDHHQEDYH
jgi:hypothetical protein